jgi:hypothetical protein
MSYAAPEYAPDHSIRELLFCTFELNAHQNCLVYHRSDHRSSDTGQWIVFATLEYSRWELRCELRCGNHRSSVHMQKAAQRGDDFICCWACK